GVVADVGVIHHLAVLVETPLAGTGAVLRTPDEHEPQPLSLVPLVLPVGGYGLGTGQALQPLVALVHPGAEHGLSSVARVEPRGDARLDSGHLDVAVDGADVRAEVEPLGSREVGQEAHTSSLATHVLDEVDAVALEPLDGSLELLLVAERGQPSYPAHVQSPKLSLHLPGRHSTHQRKSRSQGLRSWNLLLRSRW